jgi:dethiobiotin synthetase
MKLFITGIGTDVGKTIAAAIITESLRQIMETYSSR